MKLHEIADELERVMAEVIDPTTGEIAEDAIERLDNARGTYEEKAHAVAKYAQGERLEGQAIKAYAKQLDERGNTHIRHAEWLLEEYLHGCLSRQGYVVQEPFKQGTEVLLKDPNTHTEIVVTKSAATKDVGALNPMTGLPTATPKKFVKKVTTFKADRTAIRKDLLEGKKVGGWSLEWRYVIKVR